MEEASPEEDGEGSDREKEGIPDGGQCAWGGPQWIHGSCENNNKTIM